MVGLLGRGAMAVVELAVAPDGTRVARKRIALAGSAAEMDLARRRLRREAEILRTLSHPAIVPILDVEDDGTDVVIVMPALAGSLADRVATSGPLPPAQVVAMGRSLLEALAAAHRRGVVHRDIKPGNVLFDEHGRAALADFGVAVSRDATHGLTVAGTVVGTPMWMAPEQARGEPAGPAADVYALGATLRFAATGTTPHPAGPPEVVLARVARGDTIPEPGTLPGALRAPLGAMLDPDPARRPSAAEVLGGLDGTALAARIAPATPRRRPGRARTALRRAALGSDGARWSGRRRAALAAVVLAAATGVTAVALTGQGRGQRAAGASPAATLPPATTTCAPRPYQPCGAPAAAHTDGYRCAPGWYDIDGLAADGCEASSDYRPGSTLSAGTPLRANLVPAGAVDAFTTRVSGHLLSLCSGTLHLDLTAPAGTADRLEVAQGGTVLGTATSVDGQTATVDVTKPGCFGSHSETLTLQVRAVVGSSAADFTLARRGGW